MIGIEKLTQKLTANLVSFYLIYSLNSMKSIKDKIEMEISYDGVISLFEKDVVSLLPEELESTIFNPLTIAPD